jgi:membrane protein
VLQGLTRFASRAGGVGTVGLALLALTALALLLTIDRTLNQIWRVRRPRPLGQRLLVYWGAITLAPLLLGLSLTGAALALSPRALGAVLPGAVGLLLDLLQLALLAGAAAALFHYVPHTAVRWRHAWAGGVFVALGIELAKQALAAYVKAVPTYSVLYGAFAAVPLLLLWVYLAWVVVLLGAVIAAYAPSLTLRLAPRPRGPGWRFALALELLGTLAQARADGRHGVTLESLARTLRTDALTLEPLLELLAAIDWVRPLDEGDTPRHVLLCDPARTPIAPLVDRLLLEPGAVATPLLARSALPGLTLQQALAPR